MKMIRNKHFKSWKQQQGVTLIELLIAGVISLIAVSGMVMVMATTLGTSLQTIEMSRLSQQMRTATQIMTREMRRANYHSGFWACYGNPACLIDAPIDNAVPPTTADISGMIQQIQIGSNVETDDCFWFWYDRPQICPTTSCTPAQLAAAQTLVINESVAAFRRAESVDGIGRIQMTTEQPLSFSCSSGTGWVDITDPNIVDVTAFTVSNSESLIETINDDGDTQNVEKIGLIMQARLTDAGAVLPWVETNLNPTRELEAFVKVRNNVTTAAGS